MSNLIIKPARRLKGEIDLPGDKSISHRALLISSLADGISVIDGLQEGEDCRSTYQALFSLGVEIRKEGSRIRVNGRGPAGFREAHQVIDCGNSGTTMRLLSGIAAGLPFTTRLTGDESLRNRPMRRVIEPLRQMGAKISVREVDFPPLAIIGGSLAGISYRTPMASAQVKSCLLLAGLLAEGNTTIIEPAMSRDHTERMLAYFGAVLKINTTPKYSATLLGSPVGARFIEPAGAINGAPTKISSPHRGEDEGEGGNAISILGGQRLSGRSLKIPGDFSAAAFFLAAAAIVPKSKISIRGVGLNPTRIAFLDILKKMGARISIQNQREENGEPIGDITAKGGGELKGITVSGSLIPNLIDEIPILAVVALFAKGLTEVKDAGELRVKESDRIKAIVTELRKMGAGIEEREDGFLISGPQRLKGAGVNSHFDHRIAMSLAVAGLAVEGETAINNPECIAISFPDFVSTLLQIIKQ
ncbi:MAG: 3-phosphoshikimate 1-carboxyvinyltransferase [Candidatus Omnitrophota bacterium]